MDPDLIFTICNAGVLPAWLLLAFAPGWIWTQRLVHSIWIPLLIAVLYAAAFLSGALSGLPAPEGADLTSLRGVMLAFTSPYTMLAGWLPYLAFDLFVGAWEVRDARRRGIHHGFVLPGLVLTLMLGPLGLGVYLLVRGVATRAWELDEGTRLV